MKKEIKTIKKITKRKKKTEKEKLWDVFSEYIRLRDADDRGYVNCISCGKVMFWKDSQAGHFIAKSKGNYFYFLEENVHAQCYSCNVPQHGNLLDYRRRLIEKIGQDEVYKLEYQSQIGIREELNKATEHSDEHYKELKKVYQEELNQLKKLKSYVRP